VVAIPHIADKPSTDAEGVGAFLVGEAAQGIAVVFLTYQSFGFNVNPENFL